MSDRQALIARLRNEASLEINRDDPLAKDILTALEEAQGVPRGDPMLDYWPIAELMNIANAKRFDKTRFLSDDHFADWAQSRARFVLKGLTDAAPAAPTREPDDTPRDEQDARRYESEAVRLLRYVIETNDDTEAREFLSHLDAALAEPKR